MLGPGICSSYHPVLVGGAAPAGSCRYTEGKLLYDPDTVRITSGGRFSGSSMTFCIEGNCIAGPLEDVAVEYSLEEEGIAYPVLEDEKEG